MRITLVALLVLAAVTLAYATRPQVQGGLLITSALATDSPTNTHWNIAGTFSDGSVLGFLGTDATPTNIWLFCEDTQGNIDPYQLDSISSNSSTYLEGIWTYQPSGAPSNGPVVGTVGGVCFVTAINRLSIQPGVSAASISENLANGIRNFNFTTVDSIANSGISTNAADLRYAPTSAVPRIVALETYTNRIIAVESYTGRVVTVEGYTNRAAGALQSNVWAAYTGSVVYGVSVVTGAVTQATTNGGVIALTVTGGDGSGSDAPLGLVVTNLQGTVTTNNTDRLAAQAAITGDVFSVGLLLTNERTARVSADAALSNTVGLLAGYTNRAATAAQGITGATANVTITTNGQNYGVGVSAASAYTNRFQGPATTGSVTSVAGDTNSLLWGDGTWGEGLDVTGTGTNTSTNLFVLLNGTRAMTGQLDAPGLIGATNIQLGGVSRTNWPTDGGDLSALSNSVTTLNGFTNRAATAVQTELDPEALPLIVTAGVGITNAQVTASNAVAQANGVGLSLTNSLQGYVLGASGTATNLTSVGGLRFTNLTAQVMVLSFTNSLGTNSLCITVGEGASPTNYLIGLP